MVNGHLEFDIVVSPCHNVLLGDEGPGPTDADEAGRAAGQHPRLPRATLFSGCFPCFFVYPPSTTHTSTDGSVGLWAVGPLAGNRFEAIKVALPIHQTSPNPKK